MTMLLKKYKEEIAPKMKERFNYNSNLAVPEIKKIIINVGVGRLSQQPNFEKNLEFISNDISLITGQKPALTASKKSIAGFKIRAGQTVGLKTTLRRLKMYNFLQKLIDVVFPRTKDFRGISYDNIDKSGNLNIGVKEHIVFPEISTDTIKFDFGFQINIVNNAKTREEAIELYKLLGIPFKKHG